jgi:hypothetical protein
MKYLLIVHDSYSIRIEHQKNKMFFNVRLNEYENPLFKKTPSKTTNYSLNFASLLIFGLKIYPHFIDFLLTADMEYAQEYGLKRGFFTAIQRRLLINKQYY